jgi:hypothetical protein
LQPLRKAMTDVRRTFSLGRMHMEDKNIDAEWAAEAADEEADRQRKSEAPPALDRDAFLAWRSPREVSDSPTRLDNPLWHWLVRTRHSAYSANKAFDGPSAFEAGPMWCFDRFGKSETPLPDGRVVHIGGEHEDHYDPDFFIYNDVTLIDPDGSIAIHGYARETFPPTDFHSATLVHDAIFIVGGLGYPEQRVVGHTPVFRLSLDTMRVTRLETSGEAPGWIHRHSAELADDGRSIVARGGELWMGDDRSMQENIDAWSLDVANGRWTRLSALDWQRWTMVRVDRKPNRLWDVRQELWHQEHAWPGHESYWKHDDAPDFEALAALYRLDETAPAPEQGSEHNVYRMVIDGVSVRFTEDRWSVQAMVEGRLPDAGLDELQRATLATLQRLDASVWEIEPQ